MAEYASLRSIAAELGLAPNTLYGVRKRYTSWFPLPHAEVPGFYDRAAVKAWYRDNIESLPTYNRTGGRGNRKDAS